MEQRRIDEYDVVGELGRGGMGVVLEVRRADDPRRLALKRLTGELDAEGLRRFEREAQLLARLRHPAVVRIHSFQTQGAFAPYLVTELIEGDDLVALRSKGALSAERIATIMITLCEAVEALHQADLIHRDLKPGNVMIRHDGQPVLIDFGLAFDQLAQARLTEDGILLGTPVFMAPEQIVSGGRQIDARTDVYGLGGILFFLMFARNLYDGEGAEAARAVLHTDPRWPPPERHPLLPPALWRICERAIHKTLSARYPSPADLRADLERFLAGEPLAGRRVPRVGWGLPLGAAAAVVVLAGVLAARSARPAAATPTPPPSSVASATPEATTAAPAPGGDRDAGAALDRLLLLLDESPTRERALELVDWLEAHPDHPQATRARARRAELASRFPYRVWPVGYVAVVPCGQSLVGIRTDGSYERLDPERSRGEKLGSVPPPRNHEGFPDLAPSPDGRLLYALDDYVLHEIDWAAGTTRTLTLPKGIGAARELACSGNGALLAVRGRAAEKHFVALLDAKGGEPLWQTEAEIEVTEVGLSPDGRWVFCFTNDVLGELLAPILLFDVGSGAQQVVPSHLSQKGNAYAFEPASSRLAVADNAGAIHVYDLASPEAPAVLLESDDAESAWLTRGIHPSTITAVAAAWHDGWVLFSACGIRMDEPSVNELAVWRIDAAAEARLVRKFSDFPNRYLRLATTDDGRWLVAGRAAGEFELWDARALSRE